MINAVSGLWGLKVIDDLRGMVNLTYDRALMGGTFAQAAKFDFAQFDNEVTAALLAKNTESFQLHRRRARKLLETLEEDLAVVAERSLSEKSAGYISQTLSSLEAIVEFKDQLFARKEKNSGSMLLAQTWSSDGAKRSLQKNLTAMYDDAAEVGYHYRLRSEAQNAANFTRTLATLMACLLISVGLSVLIAFRIIRPLLELQKVCAATSTGDFSHRSQLRGADEFGTLALAFNYMLDTIHEKTGSMTTLLNSLPFALFYFDSGGKISSERSSATSRIFPQGGEVQGLKEFFMVHGAPTEKLDEIMRALFGKLLPFKSAAFLLPQKLELRSGEDLRIVQLSYRPKIGAGKQLESVILIGEDVTAKERALAENEVMAERVDRLSKVSRDLVGFKGFQASTRMLLDSLSDPSDLESFKRDLHSLKGVLGIYAFHTVSKKIHHLETELQKAKSLMDLELPRLTGDIRRAYEEQVADVIDVLSINVSQGFRTYDPGKVNRLIALAELSPDPEARAIIESLDRFPIQTTLAKYASHAEAVARDLPEKKVDLVFGPSDELSLSEALLLDPVLIHLVNNSIDHGIEPELERTEKNKRPRGRIEITFSRPKVGPRVLRISDDGKGIDGERLVQKAVQTGVVPESKAAHLSEDDKVHLIFAPGLSTKESASLLSGRGVGMDAVKKYLDDLGATIQVRTQRDQGTTFEIHLPGGNA